MAGLLDFFLNQYLANQQAPGLQSALFGGQTPNINVTPSLFDNPNAQSAQSQYDAQNARGMYDPNQNGAPFSGGLLGNPAQGQAFAGVDSRISVPIMQQLLAQQSNPMSQAELRGKNLANTQTDLANQLAAIALPEQRAGSEAFLSRIGAQPQGAPPNNQQPGNAGGGNFAQQMGFPTGGAGGIPMSAIQPPNAGGAAPISTKAPYSSDIVPGLDPGTAAIIGRAGVSNILGKYGEPVTLGEKDQRQNFNYRTGQMETIPNPSHQTRQVLPQQLGFPAASMPPNSFFNVAPTGQVTLENPTGAKSPQAAQQEVDIAGRSAAASATAGYNAKANFIIPPSDPRIQSWVQAITQNGAFQGRNVPEELKTSVAAALPNDPSAFAPAAKASYMSLASDIAKPYVSMKAYTLTQDGAPMLGRIAAAMQNPGSIADQELLDSFTKLSLGNGAPTDAQIKIITEGKSVRDWAQDLLKNRAVQGGILSPQQRQQIHTIAGNVFREYQNQYQPVYEEAHRKMDEAGVPKAFQSSMPDLNGIIARGQQQTTALDAARAAIAKGANPNAVKQRLKENGIDPGVLQ